MNEEKKIPDENIAAETLENLSNNKGEDEDEVHE